MGLVSPDPGLLTASLSNTPLSCKTVCVVAHKHLQLGVLNGWIEMLSIDMHHGKKCECERLLVFVWPCDGLATCPWCTVHTSRPVTAGLGTSPPPPYDPELD